MLYLTAVLATNYKMYITFKYTASYAPHDILSATEERTLSILCFQIDEHLY